MVAEEFDAVVSRLAVWGAGAAAAVAAGADEVATWLVAGAAAVTEWWAVAVPPGLGEAAAAGFAAALACGEGGLGAATRDASVSSLACLLTTSR
ncbi:MAG: hypothetical protein ABR925_05430 [Acidimicrobiales bacterium]